MISKNFTIWEMFTVYIKKNHRKHLKQNFNILRHPFLHPIDSYRGCYFRSNYFKIKEE